MSMNLTVYVGPYLTVHRDGPRLDKYDDILVDGRMEAKSPAERWHLVPNQEVPGICRDMTIDPHGNQEPQPFSTIDIEHEVRAFRDFASRAINEIKISGRPCDVRWGVVPCWS